MVKLSVPFLLAGFALFIATGGSLLARNHEQAVVESSTEVLQTLAAVRPPHIPYALLQDAQGIAIFPGVLKAGLIVGGRHGRGVILLRGPGGGWSNPVFASLTGGGVGWQVGIQSTDLVLVFKTHKGLQRILDGKGKLTLGADVAVAAGPVGRQAEASTDARLRAEIYSYARSRGLFVGVSVEGAALRVDCGADEAYYHVRGGKPKDIQAVPALPVPLEAAKLKALVTALTTPPPPVRVVLPPLIVPVPPPPPGLPPAPVPIPPPPSRPPAP